jgi:Domain of unknown function (DUF222)
METALHSLDQAVRDLSRVCLDELDRSDLGVLAIRVGRHIDKMKMLHSRIVVEADRARSWQASGARDVEDWLSSKTGTSRGEAQSRKKLGEALDKSKDLSDAVDNDELSAAAAEQLHDAVMNPPEGTDADDLADLIDSAKGEGPKAARAAADRWRDAHTSESAEERTARRHAKRSVTSRPAADGVVESTVVLPELEHRQFMNAISHAAGDWDANDTRTSAQRLADGLTQLCKAYAAGTVTGGREKPTILIGCSAETMAGLSDEPGWTSHGDRIPADVVRHLAEDAILRRVVMAGDAVINLGNRVRFATDDQYQALMMRDGGCRWPGCDIPAAWCEVDHLIPVTEGGPSDLDNEVLWCSHHHHVKHRSGVTVLGDAHHLHLLMPDGALIACPSRGRGRTARAAA